MDDRIPGGRLDRDRCRAAPGPDRGSGRGERRGQGLVAAVRDSPVRGRDGGTDGQGGAGAEVFTRWQNARLAAVAALRAADPTVARQWIDTPLKSPTLATTRLAEHWAHALDITEPLGLELPDTGRLRQIAWLAHRSLAYAFALSGQESQPVYCELIAPDGVETWQFGPADAESQILGAAGAFCRVAAQRLARAQSGLVASGPYGEAALAVLRTYAA